MSQKTLQKVFYMLHCCLSSSSRVGIGHREQKRQKIILVMESSQNRHVAHPMAPVVLPM